MAEHTYEIAYWPASDLLKKDLSVCQPVVDVVKRHTPLPIFAGISVESALFYIVVAWENSDAHKKFIAHPDYQTIQADFAPLFPEGGAAGSTAVHAHFDDNPLSLFEAKVVEHVYLTPQDGVSLDELKSTLLRSHEVLAQHKDLSNGGVIGTMEERPDQLVVVAGWESLEAHQKFTGPGGPVADEIFPELLSKVRVDIAKMEHVSYTRFA